MSASSGRWNLSRVLADGCFDPIHYGHIRYLREAKTLGDVLIVRVAPDAAIEAKGRKPFQPRQDRALTVFALGVVSRVSLQETLADAVLELRPRYLAKGIDWRGHVPADVLAACQTVGAEIVFLNTDEPHSSERLLA